MSAPGAGAEAAAGDPGRAALQDAHSADARKPGAALRLEAVRISDTLHADGLPRGDADALAAAVARVAPATVGRWRAKVRGLPQDERHAALTDRKPTGRPPLITGAVRETLEALARRCGPRLTARLARRTVVARCGRAPALSTVSHWLARYRRERAPTPGDGALADATGRGPA